MYLALGLLNISVPPVPPDPYHPLQDEGEEGGQWVASRMVTDRPPCERDRETQPYVRALVHDEVRPLQFCGDEAEKMCALGNLV